MQFFFLLLFNVFLGAVLYLVISLKLERSATEFRERRFRKEMDEIIKEFNSTAERNISLLETRIRVLRRLLEKTGGIKSLDITLAEEEAAEQQAAAREHRPAHPADAVISRDRPRDRAPLITGGENNGGALIKKGLLLLFEKFIDILPAGKGAGAADIDMAGEEMYDAGDEPDEPVYREVPEAARVSIEKDMALMMPAAPPEVERSHLTEEEIGEIIASSDDRYKMVSLLFEHGCGVEDISRHSGIPVGEVRLVLNLSRSRDMTGNTR